MKKVISLALTLCLTFSVAFFCSMPSTADSGKHKGQGKSLAELSSAWLAVKLLEVPDTFVTEPNYTTAPYAAGELSPATQDYATAYLNFARYLAGVKSVKWTTEGAKYAQAAAVLNRSKGSTYLSHSPGQPDGMDQDLYVAGLRGSAWSNLSRGYSSIYDAIGTGWLNDSSESNISNVGHRCNFLSPTLPSAGFGRADKHYAGISLDVEFNNDFMWELNKYRGTVMYPAPGYFPIQALPNGSNGGAAWSIQFDRTYSMDNSDFIVTVNNRTKDEITTLTESDQDKVGKYLNKPHNDIKDLKYSASTSLGMISFRVSPAALQVGDEYTITVSGIKNRDNEALPNITYDVCLVDMNNLPPLTPNMKGDVDADDEINASDAVLALRIITGNASATEKQLWAARVEADDTAAPTVTDALLILKKSLGLLNKFPAESN